MRNVGLQCLCEPLSQNLLACRNGGLLQEETQNLLAMEVLGPLSDRLELEKAVIEATRLAFCLDEEALLREIGQPGFDQKALELACLKGYCDWRLIEGQKRYSRQSVKNIRASLKLDGENQWLGPLLEQSMADMKAKGSMEASITMKLEVAPVKSLRRLAIAHLPLAQIGQSQHYLEILDTDAKAFKISSENSEQRVVAIRDSDSRPYTVTYSYVNQSSYVDIDPTRLAGTQPGSFTKEEPPFIVFSPYLRELAKDIVGKASNPALKARRIYDWITTHVNNSCMPDYLCLDNIAEVCAASKRGDSVLQTALFITLCRLCRIPSRWQSGLFVSPQGIFEHSWAVICLEPYGYRPVDLFFGNLSYKQSRIPLWNFYFGNLDVYRLVASSNLGSSFDVYPKKFFRADPVNNLKGEIEYSDHGLGANDLKTDRKLIRLELS